jgi:hypothetical protein
MPSEDPMDPLQHQQGPLQHQLQQVQQVDLHQIFFFYVDYDGGLTK